MQLGEAAPAAHRNRTAPIGLRVFPSKAALEKAAKEAYRPMASVAEWILTEWLRERGYLPK
jgi:hypothetical protein